jgi:biotin carboxyl carrier protein
MNRQFKIKVNGTEHHIDLHGNSMLVDDVPFVIGEQEGMLTVDGIAFDVKLEQERAVVDGQEYEIDLNGMRLRMRQQHRGASEAAIAPAGPGAVTAVMPGLIIKLKVAEGNEVKVGDVLLILEAMKMENEIAAERDGVVKKIHIEAGDRVENGQPLLDIE